MTKSTVVRLRAKPQAATRYESGGSRVGNSTRGSYEPPLSTDHWVGTGNIVRQAHDRSNIEF